MFSILIGTSLMSICLGQSLKEATSSIRFDREDVPLSYEYSSVHLYDTKNTKNKRDSNINANFRPQTLPKKYKSIQYAPIVVVKATIPENEPSDVPESEVEINTNLEPKLSENTDLHNIPIPVVNAPDYVIKKKTKSHNSNVMVANRMAYTYPNIGNYFTGKSPEQPHHNVDKQDNQEITDSIKHLAASEPKGYLSPNQHFDVNAEKSDKSVQTLSALENRQNDPIFNQYVKPPIVHLNVARAYKIAIRERQARIKENQNLFLNRDDQQLIPDIEELFAKDTLLKPVKHKKYLN